MSELKPGEFVGADGRIRRAGGVTLLADNGEQACWITHENEDFPAAVEALKALVPEPFEWESDGTSYTRRCVAGHVELKRKDGWVEAPVCTADFNAGRRYERERGHADE